MDALIELAEKHAGLDNPQRAVACRAAAQLLEIAPDRVRLEYPNPATAMVPRSAGRCFGSEPSVLTLSRFYTCLRLEPCAP
jgi:hypothetical protein